jgi:hypothetical protein
MELSHIWKDVSPMVYRYKKDVCRHSWIKRTHIQIAKLQRNYQQLAATEPLVSKVEEFIADELLTGLVQAFYGDDLGIYISNNMLSYYANRISYALSIILRDLSFKNVLHSAEFNQLLILIISYTIAIVCVLMEAEKL